MDNAGVTAWGWAATAFIVRVAAPDKPLFSQEENRKQEASKIRTQGCAWSMRLTEFFMMTNDLIGEKND
jgi:hypothetical protein